MSIRAEANISMQGAKWEIVTETGRTSLLYINVPIVFRYRHSTGFFGEAGFQPGLLLSAKDIYEGESEDYKDYFRTVDFGIPVGAGYEFGNGIGVGLRVIPGISRINRNGYTIDRNNIVSLRATYTFILK